MRSAALTSLLLSACNPGDLPGREVGTFRVSARLDENGCGPSAQASVSVEFDVEIRRDGDRGYWIPQGQAPVSGVLDERGAFLFQVASRVAVREEDPAAGLAACTMDRFDEVRGTVTVASDADASAVAPGRLLAEETLSIGATSGSDCSDRIGLGEGQFIGLPCQIRYGLEGDELASPE
jgi:hypothetical protein